MRLLVLVSAAAALSGCLLKPDKVDVHPADAHVKMDAAVQTVNARLIRNAYFDNGQATTPGMSSTGYQIATQGINPGDLVLFIANIDNGSDAAWMLPGNFIQIKQKFFGQDGQTFVVAWHVADNSEPANYMKSYGGSNISSAAATISLVAITGADPTNPINTHDEQIQETSENPVYATSNGVTTTVPGCLLVYASGADWLGNPSSGTFTTPSGFMSLAAFGDDGNGTWAWSTQMVAVKFQSEAGASGIVSGKTESVTNGMPWTVLLAIAPAAQ